MEVTVKNIKERMIKMGDYECPYCEELLKYKDYYGKNLMLDNFDRPKPGFVKSGDIYKCENDRCIMYQESFHTDATGELHEGYPC